MKVIIVGAGPGGIDAALTARELGHEVVLIEKNKVGGTVLFGGCLWSKFGYWMVRRGESVDFQAFQARSEQTIERELSRLLYELKISGVEIVYQEVTQVGEKYVLLKDGSSLHGDFVVLACGSIPRPMPELPVDHVRVFNSDSLERMTSLPRSMTIIGSGIIGCELACLFNGFGTKVKLLERAKFPVKTEGPMVGRWVLQSLRAQGIDVQTEVAFEVKNSQVYINGKLDDSETIFLAIGRTGSSITANPKIPKIGDALVGAGLAHVAKFHARHLFGGSATCDIQALPRVMFTTPEVGIVGKFHEKLQFYGANFTEHPLGDFLNWEGKFVIGLDQHQVISFAAIMGYGAQDMIMSLSQAMAQGLDRRGMMEMWIPHPTLGELIHVALQNRSRKTLDQL